MMITPGWHHRAGCLGTGGFYFFSDHHADQIVAKRVCWACPVRAECRASVDEEENGSLSPVLVHGIRGGENATERIMRRRLESKHGDGGAWRCVACESRDRRDHVRAGRGSSE